MSHNWEGEPPAEADSAWRAIVRTGQAAARREPRPPVYFIQRQSFRSAQPRFLFQRTADQGQLFWMFQTRPRQTNIDAGMRGANGDFKRESVWIGSHSVAVMMEHEEKIAVLKKTRWKVRSAWCGFSEGDAITQLEPIWKTTRPHRSPRPVRSLVSPTPGQWRSSFRQYTKTLLGFLGL